MGKLEPNPPRIRPKLPPAEMWVACPDCGKERAYNRKDVQKHGVRLCLSCVKRGNNYRSHRR